MSRGTARVYPLGVPLPGTARARPIGGERRPVAQRGAAAQPIGGERSAHLGSRLRPIRGARGCAAPTAAPPAGASADPGRAGCRSRPRGADADPDFASGAPLGTTSAGCLFIATAAELVQARNSSRLCVWRTTGARVPVAVHRDRRRARSGAKLVPSRLAHHSEHSADLLFIATAAELVQARNSSRLCVWRTKGVRNLAPRPMPGPFRLPLMRPAQTPAQDGHSDVSGAAVEESSSPRGKRRSAQQAVAVAAAGEPDQRQRDRSRR